MCLNVAMFDTGAVVNLKNTQCTQVFFGRIALAYFTEFIIVLKLLRANTNKTGCDLNVGHLFCCIVYGLVLLISVPRI